MPIDVTSISSLDSTLVNEREQLLIQMLTEAFPNIDFSRGGILQQLVAHPNAVLDGINRQEIENLRNSMSILTIQENPEIADAAIVDAVLSNYLLTRTAATSAQGVMAVVLSNLTTVTIPATANFVVAGRTFNPKATVLAVTSTGLLVDDNSVLIQGRSDGSYWFTFEVIENVTGGTAAIVQGTTFALDTEPASFVSAYAASDFIPGTTAESNEQFLTKVTNGITTKAMSDRQSVTALIKEQFPQVTDMSIIGYGDFEMSRDRANIFGIGCGSKADIYVRCGAVPVSTKITVMTMASGAYVGGYNPWAGWGTGTGQAIMEINIPPTVFPGFYKVDKVTNVDPSGLEDAITVYEPVDRGVYRPADELAMPYITTAVQARNSKYQGAATLRIVSPETQDAYYAGVATRLANTDTISVWYNGKLHTLSVQDQLLGIDLANEPSLGGLINAGFRLYDVYLSGVESLADIQSFVNTRQRQSPTADYLVKAAIPCIVSVDITIGYRAGSLAPDIAVVQQAVADAVNSVTFDAADLQASFIIDRVSTALAGSGYVIMPITLTGTLYNPDGTTTPLSNSNYLAIPDNTTLGVSRRNTAYYCYPSNVTVHRTAVTSWGV